jgi:hypothetical protein
MDEHHVPAHLTAVGGRFLSGLGRLAARHEAIVAGVAGLPEMCHLSFRDETVSGRVASACAARGLLFKRSAYNFVSLAHDAAAVDRALELLDDALSEVGRSV